MHVILQRFLFNVLYNTLYHKRFFYFLGSLLTFPWNDPIRAVHYFPAKASFLQIINAHFMTSLKKICLMKNDICYCKHPQGTRNSSHTVFQFDYKGMIQTDVNDFSFFLPQMTIFNFQRFTKNNGKRNKDIGAENCTYFCHICVY